MNIASIDIGTNTILLLIAKIKDKGKLIPLRNEYRMPRIGKGVSELSNISSEKISELLSVLKEYAEIIREYNCLHTLVVGTNLFRLAKNTDE